VRWPQDLLTAGFCVPHFGGNGDRNLLPGDSSVNMVVGGLPCTGCCEGISQHGARDVGLLSAQVSDRLTGGVFVGDAVLLDVTFTAARARLANLARGGSLLSVSEDAYNGGSLAWSESVR
jgi:hypothetical protein